MLLKLPHIDVSRTWVTSYLRTRNGTKKNLDCCSVVHTVHGHCLKPVNVFIFWSYVILSISPNLEL